MRRNLPLAMDKGKLRPTPEELIVTYELGFFASPILKLARPCLRGTVSETPSLSYAGGLPLVDEGFVWPLKDGVPMQFVAQIDAAAVPGWKRDHGVFLFFYDSRSSGCQRKDVGHVKILWSSGSRSLAFDEMPKVTRTRNVLLWKSSKILSPTITKQVYLEFYSSRSFPSLDRQLLKLPDEATEEAYCEFLTALESPVQIGGYPSPIQSDDMESNCSHCLDLPHVSWDLMLQISEIGDQRWGDAGTLYWFIPSEDLSSGRWDRVWMVCQCF